MKVLVHYRKSEIEKSLSKLIELKDQYLQNSYGIEKEILDLFHEIEAFFKQIGNTSNESKISSLKIYLDSAIKGINPETLDLVKLNRRKVIKASSFHCLSESSILLENELLEVDQLLKNCYSHLSQLILSVLQSKAITRNELALIKDITQVEALWARLTSSNDQIALINTKLKADVLPQDIVLVLDQVITQIK
ncbi:MAG: hypothetical protein P1U56_23385 [Saprospiraceae bacterium]|nr:hypothetical protein [Saprospiraceae bacterium]